jgi:tryptophan 7-halogenase
MGIREALGMDIRKICILGGGTAGWMAAAGLSNKFKNIDVDIVLVESEQIGTVGVGEATLPHIRYFNAALKIDEAEFMKATESTFKLGIEFCDWGKLGDSYIHPFGEYGNSMDGVEFQHLWLKQRQSGSDHRMDDYSLPIVMAQNNKFRQPSADHRQIESTFGYAYQFDSSLYAKFLRRFSEANGVERREGKVVETNLNPQSGFVESIKLDSGDVIEAELFIDCSGFRGVLIEQALETGYDDWSNWLPCNRAVAIPCETNGPLTPYTRATARKAGWQWRIPLQHRVGNGHVYWNEFISDDEATHQLVNSLEGPALAEPNQLYFKTGRRKKFWNKNVVAIGLSAGFLEPLESTSIHLIQEGITELLQLFPDTTFQQSDSDEYNARMGLNYERIRDFLLLHYVATQRDDSEMWRYFRNMTLPDSLKDKLDAWLSRAYIIKYQQTTFLPPSWIAVLTGQNLIPQTYDPRADAIRTDAVVAEIEKLRQTISSAARKMPDHSAFLSQYGAASHTAPLAAA